MNVLIVEDDLIILEGLKSIVSKLGCKVKTSLGLVSSLDIIENEAIDFVIIDIDLKGDKDGIWLATFLNKHYSIPFIYVTGNDDKQVVKRAVATNPCCYLIKPFKLKDIEVSIEMVKNRIKSLDENKNVNSSFYVLEDNTYKKISFNNILYIEDKKNSCKVYTKETTISLEKTIKDMKMLLPDFFIQIHSFVLINSKYILRMCSEFVELEGGYIIPIGTEYFNSLKAILDIKNM